MRFLFDIGGSNARFAISSDGKTILKPIVIPTPKDFQKGLEIIKEIAKELIEGQKIEALSGGVAGVLDSEKSMLIASPHISGWVNKPLKEELVNIFKCPVYLENDANLATLGEATYGAGKGYKIVSYLTIGTGVGGGRVVEGKIDQNALGFEPGHQIIVAAGNLCSCGGKGHLEAYVSGSGLQSTWGKVAEEIKDPKIWIEVAKYLSAGLNNVVVFWSPDIIVLGGSVMQSIPQDALKTYLKEALTIFPNPPQISLSKLGDFSTLYGALEYLRQSHVHVN